MVGTSAHYDQGVAGSCLASEWVAPEWVAPEAQNQASKAPKRQVGVQQAAVYSPQHEEGAVSCCLANEWVLERIPPANPNALTSIEASHVRRGRPFFIL
jgi:hypothetical protein